MNVLLGDNLLDDSAAAALADLLAAGLVAKLDLSCNELSAGAIDELRLSQGDSVPRSRPPAPAGLAPRVFAPSSAWSRLFVVSCVSELTHPTRMHPAS